MISNNIVHELAIGSIRVAVTDKGQVEEYLLHKFIETDGEIKIHMHFTSAREGKFFKTKEELLKTL